jgi:hypothetical protein
MDKTTEQTVQDFVKERNEVLLRADLDEVVAFQKKYNEGMDWSSVPRHIQEVGMHKAITAVTILPRQHRLKSKRWLTERGYQSFDDGDLNDA